MKKEEQLFFGSLFYIFYFSIFSVASSALFESGYIVSGFLSLLFTAIGVYYRLSIEKPTQSQSK